MIDDANQGLSGSGITVTMANGSGLFADMAELVGDYTAAIELKNIKYSGMTLGTDENPVAATMSTTCVGKETTQVRQAYLEAVKTAANSLTANSTTASATPLNDVYGYIIDLFVRTNAGGSSLLLQTAAANRIYDDGQNEDVMGGGANMTFTLGQGVKLDDAKNLLKAFRIVFFDRTNNGKVYAEARLDSTSVQTVLGSDGTTQYQVPMKIWIPESTETVDSTTTTYTPAHYAGEAVAQEVNGVEQTEAVISGEKPVITALTQNAATSVSVLVYIDGTNLTNADVANAATSMTGKLNLQFSSDADLKPMDYSPLKEPKPAS